MQFQGKQPIGVVYNTSMNRPDAALALAMLYGFEGRRESRMGSVCVDGSGLAAAVFCDLMYRFYALGPPRNANQVLPAGLASVNPLPPDPPMVKTAVERASYVRGIRRVSDTSLAEAVIRNGVIYNAQAFMILSAPATSLARSLDIQGTKEIYKARVKMLVVVDSGAPQDVPAMRRVLAEWPGPIVLCGKEVGDALPFPGSSIEKDFAWAPAHPVVDAYRAFKPMPYDAPSYDMAAVLYAEHPDSGLFDLSAPGALTVSDDGRLRFAPGGGSVRAIVVDPSKKDKIVQAYIEIAGAKPVAPPQRFRPPQADKKLDKKATP